MTKKTQTSPTPRSPKAANATAKTEQANSKAEAPASARGVAKDTKPRRGRRLSALDSLAEQLAERERAQIAKSPLTPELREMLLALAEGDAQRVSELSLSVPWRAIGEPRKRGRKTPEGAPAVPSDKALAEFWGEFDRRRDGRSDESGEGVTQACWAWPHNEQVAPEMARALVSGEGALGSYGSFLAPRAQKTLERREWSASLFTLKAHALDAAGVRGDAALEAIVSVALFFGPTAIEPLASLYSAERMSERQRDNVVSQWRAKLRVSNPRGGFAQGSPIWRGVFVDQAAKTLDAVLRAQWIKEDDLARGLSRLLKIASRDPALESYPRADACGLLAQALRARDLSRPEWGEWGRLAEAAASADGRARPADAERWDVALPLFRAAAEREGLMAAAKDADQSGAVAEEAPKTARGKPRARRV
jgi:hypothetical protein